MIALLWLTLAACTPGSEAPKAQDPDEDGWLGDEDCGPQDPLVNPAAPELCDGEDDDCDGEIDEDAVDASSWAPDTDGDGWGRGDPLSACEAPAGYARAGDCDDQDPLSAPGLPERCGDLSDNDCDGQVDEADGAPPAAPDQDQDGYGDTSLGESLCELPPGWVTQLGDCDDQDPLSAPGLPERCGDQADNDCDGEADEADAIDALSWEPDTDGDTWGLGAPVSACEAPAGYGTPGDCDDEDADSAPDRPERCGDARDNDCDGDDDEADAIDAASWAPDLDLDGYGDPIWALPSCEAPPGWVLEQGDCDDSDPQVSPAAEELCGDGLDNDCDGLGGPDCGAVGQTSLSEARTRLRGETRSDQIGRVMAAGGDLNGDGLDDLLLGAPLHNWSTRNDGVAYVVFGGSIGDSDLSAADAVLVGAGRGSSAGSALAILPDLSGDGRDEALIGAWTETGGDSASGAAYVVLGGATGERSLSSSYARYLGESADDGAGVSLSGAGDMDGDGLEDLLIGATGSDRGASDAGAVYLVTGVQAGEHDLADASAIFTGETASDHAGEALAALGDCDGDGNTDLLIGASGADPSGGNSGAAYLVLGPVSGSFPLAYADLVMDGEATNDYAGAAVAAAGDTNGDGYADWLVAARGQDLVAEDAGLVYVLLGPPSGSMQLSSADATLVGSSAFTYAGYAVAGVGDIDQDGFDDALIGAHYADEAGSDAGAAYLLNGPFSGVVSVLDASATLTGEAADDQAGTSVAGAGDHDGDGWLDLLIGAPGQDTTDTDAGAAYLILGGAGL